MPTVNTIIYLHTYIHTNARSLYGCLFVYVCERTKLRKGKDYERQWKRVAWVRLSASFTRSLFGLSGTPVCVLYILMF